MTWSVWSVCVLVQVYLAAGAGSLGVKAPGGTFITNGAAASLALSTNFSSSAVGGTPVNVSFQFCNTRSTQNTVLGTFAASVNPPWQIYSLPLGTLGKGVCGGYMVLQYIKDSSGTYGPEPLTITSDADDSTNIFTFYLTGVLYADCSGAPCGKGGDTGATCTSNSNPYTCTCTGSYTWAGIPGRDTCEAPPTPSSSPSPSATSSISQTASKSVTSSSSMSLSSSNSPTATNSASQSESATKSPSLSSSFSQSFSASRSPSLTPSLSSSSSIAASITTASASKSVPATPSNSPTISLTPSKSSSSSLSSSTSATISISSSSSPSPSSSPSSSSSPSASRSASSSMSFSSSPSLSASSTSSMTPSTSRVSMTSSPSASPSADSLSASPSIASNTCPDGFLRIEYNYSTSPRDCTGLNNGGCPSGYYILPGPYQNWACCSSCPGGTTKCLGTCGCACQLCPITLSTLEFPPRSGMSSWTSLGNLTYSSTVSSGEYGIGTYTAFTNTMYDTPEVLPPSGAFNRITHTANSQNMWGSKLGFPSDAAYLGIRLPVVLHIDFFTLKARNDCSTCSVNWPTQFRLSGSLNGILWNSLYQTSSSVPYVSQGQTVRLNVSEQLAGFYSWFRLDSFNLVATNSYLAIDEMMLAGDTACNDVDECVAGTHNCMGREVCSNTFGSFECSCPAGFTGLGSGCLNDIDECLSAPCLGQNALCNNTAGSYECICEPGFQDFSNVCGTCEGGREISITDCTCTCAADYPSPRCATGGCGTRDPAVGVTSCLSSTTLVAPVTISDGDGDYSNSMTCNWYVSNVDAIIIHNFDMEISWDKVWVYVKQNGVTLATLCSSCDAFTSFTSASGWTYKDVMLYPESGSGQHASRLFRQIRGIYPDDAQVHFRFVSDSSVTRSGFEVCLTAAQSSQNCTVLDHCFGRAYSATGTTPNCQCDCHPGFNGSRCELPLWPCYDIDECQTGTHSCGSDLCINENGNFSCACGSGYTNWPTCEGIPCTGSYQGNAGNCTCIAGTGPGPVTYNTTHITGGCTAACLPSDCNNRANSVVGYVGVGCTCGCLPGYGGASCEHVCGAGSTGSLSGCGVCDQFGYKGNSTLVGGVWTDCAIAPCSPGAVAPNCAQCDVTNYQGTSEFNNQTREWSPCSCIAGKAGPDCAFSVCVLADACFEAGTLAVTGYAPSSCVCACKFQYSGRNCSAYTPLCQHEDCLHAQTFNETSVQPNCGCTNCRDGWTGLTCNVAPTAQNCTVGNDCNNRATSVSGLQGACTCGCKAGWIALACQTRDPFVLWGQCNAADDCNSHGTVRGAPPFCVCTCSAPYYGPRCEFGYECGLTSPRPAEGYCSTQQQPFFDVAPTTITERSAAGNYLTYSDCEWKVQQVNRIIVEEMSLTTTSWISVQEFYNGSWVSRAANRYTMNQLIINDGFPSFPNNMAQFQTSVAYNPEGRIKVQFHTFSTTASGFRMCMVPILLCTNVKHCNGRAGAVSGRAPDCVCANCANGYNGSSCEVPPAGVACDAARDCNGRGLSATGLTPSCTCVCGGGFTGPLCAGAPVCAPGVSCGIHTINASGVPPACNCQCEDGWVGSNCEEQLCTVAADCSGRATSVTGQRPGICTCICAAGWTGSSCQFEACSSDVHCHGFAAAVTGTSPTTCYCSSCLSGTQNSALRCEPNCGTGISCPCAINTYMPTNGAKCLPLQDPLCERGTPEKCIVCADNNAADFGAGCVCLPNYYLRTSTSVCTLLGAGCKTGDGLGNCLSCFDPRAKPVPGTSNCACYDGMTDVDPTTQGVDCRPISGFCAYQLFVNSLNSAVFSCGPGGPVGTSCLPPCGSLARPRPNVVCRPKVGSSPLVGEWTDGAGNGPGCVPICLGFNTLNQATGCVDSFEGVQCSVTCKAGFELVGASKPKCVSQAAGMNWDQRDVKCEVKETPCDLAIPPPPVNDVRFTVSGGGCKDQTSLMDAVSKASGTPKSSIRFICLECDDKYPRSYHATFEFVHSLAFPAQDSYNNMAKADVSKELGVATFEPFTAGSAGPPKKKGKGWIAGVVIGILILLVIIVFIVYKKKKAAPVAGQRQSNDGMFGKFRESNALNMAGLFRSTPNQRASVGTAASDDVVAVAVATSSATSTPTKASRSMAVAKFYCPQGHEFSVSATIVAGSVVACPSCNTHVKIPEEGSVAPPKEYKCKNGHGFAIPSVSSPGSVVSCPTCKTHVTLPAADENLVLEDNASELSPVGHSTSNKGDGIAAPSSMNIDMEEEGDTDHT
eukprot:gb/GEZN01000108.1/.p1 GENE.gb/GEZN01000108.1/~~gb/GEZN01000108.1/.p1  ORF type:complete len:2281 (-),score=97.31 gb/GEZN01000108.1/:181-6945(-)